MKKERLLVAILAALALAFSACSSDDDKGGDTSNSDFGGCYRASAEVCYKYEKSQENLCKAAGGEWKDACPDTSCKEELAGGNVTYYYGDEAAEKCP